MVQKLRPKDSSTDMLFVGTDKQRYFTLAWDEETQQLETVQSFPDDESSKHMRESQSQDLCIVDPTGRFMALHLWEGVLAVMRMLPRKGKTNELEWMESARLSELFVKASTFLYSDTGHPKIAFLYQSRSDLVDSKLAIYRLTSDDKDTQASKFDSTRDKEFAHDIPDPGASLIIPVRRADGEKRHISRNNTSAKAFLGGLIVVGETRLTYIDDATHGSVEVPLKEASIFVAWAPYNDRIFFLADDYGRLYMLTIVTVDNGTEVADMEMVYLQKTSRASCLVFLDGFLFVGSHYGDSQLWKVDFNVESVRQMTQLTQVISNVAPILDFAVMDMGNREGDSHLGNAYSSGQARLVTGSGVHKDGTLRSVRSGVGLEDIGTLGELEDARGIFSLKSNGSEKVDVLAVSFLTETRVFKFEPTGDVEEVEAFEGLSFEHQTHLACDLPNNRRLQVTTAAAILFDKENGMCITSWVPDHGQTITAASANSKYAILSVDGKSLVSLDLVKDLVVSSNKDFQDTDQVACVHASPRLLDVGVVGFFTSGNISIIDLATLEPQRGESLRKTDDNSSIPRDIALIQTLPENVGGPTLFVSMEDGHVVTFNVSSDLSLSGRKSVILGTQQARLHLLSRPGGLINIFATTENPSLIYGSEGRIVYSAVTAEDATYVCDFDAEAYPDSVMVATESTIKISKIDNERRTHVKSLEMGEMVRRIAYSPKEQVFGLGCIKRELSHGEELITSSFKLVDDVIFAKVGKPFLLDQSSSPELVECVIRATLPDSYGNPAERFLVGTSFLVEDGGASRGDETRGRLLVLGVDSDRNPYLLASQKFKGSCRCLAVMHDDLIVIGLTKTVVMGKYVEKSSTEGSFHRSLSYRPSTYPVTLAVHGNIIGVGDLTKSLSLVEYFPEKDDKPAILIEIARNLEAGWVTAIAHIEDHSWMQADSEGNLSVLRRNVEGPTPEDQKRMEMTSEFNLGEQVNSIRKMEVETSPNALMIPKAFLSTVR